MITPKGTIKTQVSEGCTMDSPAKRRNRPTGTRMHADGLGIASWQWDLESDEFHCSDEWKRIRGLEGTTISNVPNERLSRVHPDDLDDLECRRKELIRGECESYECDHRVRHSDGSWIWIAERCRAVCESDKVVRLLACDFEITKRKHEELDLRQSQLRYTALADAFPAALVQFNGDGHIEYASDYLNELTGRPVESAMGHGWQKAVHPEDLPKILQHIAELSEGPANQERVADGIPARHLRPDGSIHWFQSKLRIRYGPDGTLTSMIAVLIDIDERRQLEQKQALLASIVEATPDLIGVSNPQREILYHNKRAIELLPELSHPENRADFIDAHPPWAQKIILEEAIPAAIEHGSWTGETAILGDDGKERPVSQVFIAHKSPDGTLEAFSTIIRDISEQKAMEQALRESETTFASLAAAAPAIFFRFVDGNNCVYVNQRWADLTGRPVEEALGQKWMKCIHPDDLPARQQQIQSFLADDSRMIDEPTEERLVLPDGTLRQVVVHIAKELDESGNVAGLVGTLTDVTERREVELALNQSEDKFKRIVEGVAEVIWSTDSNYIFTYLSPRFESMFGFDPADWIGKDPFEMIHPEDLNGIEKLIIDQNDEGPTNAEFRHLCADGSYLWVSANSTPIADEGGRITGFHGVLRDISARKAAELALRESDQRFASLAATAQAGIFRMSDENECVYVNERWGELTGRPMEDALGRGWMASVHPVDFKWIQEETRAFIADDTRNVDNPKEIRHVLPDGSPCRVLLHLAKEKDEHGNVTGLVGTLTDIERTRAAEVALLESDTKFQRVIEQVPGVVFRFKMRPDGTDELLYVNSRIRDIFELEPEEALNDSSKIWGRMHRDDVERVAAEAAEAAKSSDTLKQEYRLELPKKGIRWVQVTSHRTLEDNGDVIWDGILTDQTEQKVATLALQDSETKFQRVTEHVPGMFFRYIFHPDATDELAYVSSGVLDIFGVEPEEAIGEGVSKVWERIHDGDRDSLAKEVAVSAEKLTPLIAEYRLIFPEGVRYAQTYAQPFRSENGDVTWDGVVLDHTERKVAQLALQESQSQFQRIAENIPGMIYRYVQYTDGRHAMTHVGAQSRELFGVEPEAAIEDADTLFNLIHPDDLAPVMDAIRVSRETMKPFKEEFRVALPDHSLRWLENIGQSSRTDEGDTIWDGVIVDITDRKKVELQLQLVNDELKKATKLKDEFLATMSHELRSPLSAILSTSEALEDGVFGSVTPDQKEGYDVIQKSAEHLLSLIDEVLDLAKIESGSVDLEISAVDIRDLCESSLELIAQQAVKKNIELNLSIPFGLPELAADEKRMRQVLVNLLSNAVKFTPESGKVSVDVQREKTGESEETLRIVVSDTGIGIDPGQQDSLFEPFVQADSSLSRSYEGTGLGLALVKRFVQLHFGNVSVTSEVGVGSRFTVEMPYHQTVSSVTTPPDSPQDTAQSSKSSLPTVAHQGQSLQPMSARILLAEDNEMVAFAITKGLKSKGFHVELVSNGQAAIEAAQKSVPDIILMDVQMPVMDGLEAIEKIREIPGLEKVPIIALTGLAMPEDANRCVRAGANKHLSKPFRLQALVDSIGEFVPKVIR